MRKGGGAGRQDRPRPGLLQASSLVGRHEVGTPTRLPSSHRQELTLRCRGAPPEHQAEPPRGLAGELGFLS